MRKGREEKEMEGRKGGGRDGQRKEGKKRDIGKEGGRAGRKDIATSKTQDPISLHEKSYLLKAFLLSPNSSLRKVASRL